MWMRSEGSWRKKTCEVLFSPTFRAKSLRWRVCRVNFARKIFIELRIFLRKMLRNFPRLLLSLYSAGQKNPAKFPPNFPAKFPCEKSKKNHRRASGGAQGEEIVRAPFLVIFSRFFPQSFGKSRKKVPGVSRPRGQKRLKKSRKRVEKVKKGGFWVVFDLFFDFFSTFFDPGAERPRERRFVLQKPWSWKYMQKIATMASDTWFGMKFLIFLDVCHVCGESGG